MWMSNGNTGKMYAISLNSFFLWFRQQGASGYWLNPWHPFLTIPLLGVSTLWSPIRLLARFGRFVRQKCCPGVGFVIRLPPDTGHSALCPSLLLLGRRTCTLHSLGKSKCTCHSLSVGDVESFVLQAWCLTRDDEEAFAGIAQVT